MDFVKENPAVFEHFSSHSRLEDTVVGQGCVGPSDETIVTIPGALSMAQKAKIVGCFIIDAQVRALLLLLLVLLGFGGIL